MELTDAKNQFVRSLKIVIAFTAVLWIVWGADMLFNLDLPKYGIIPRTTVGLRGILLSPFIHDNRNVWHILSNTPPFMVLFFILLNAYGDIAITVLVLIHLLTGFFVWLFAPALSVHVGISGVIYGLATFLLGSGIFRRDIKSLTISIIIIVFYGGMVQGFKPVEGISWESHVSGAVVGFFLAFNFRNYNRPPRTFLSSSDDTHFFERHP